MRALDRREFLRAAAAGLGAGLGGRPLAAAGTGAAPSTAAPPRRPLRATDVVSLGKTGIRPSRLSVGTGSNGAEQRKRGVPGMVKLLRHALDRGVFWWETADLYKTHPHVRAALDEVRRERVVITSKTTAKDAAGVRKDVERFRKELGTDYIDILLLHCVSAPDWPDSMRGPMDALSEAKHRGHVRAIGCSLHIQDPRHAASLAPLRAAARTTWGDVFLVRINPYAVNMDVEKPEDIPSLEKVFQAMRDRGKALYGMKILGGTNPHVLKSRIGGDRIDGSLRFALTRPYLSGFTIGFSREKDLDDIIRRVERIGRRAGGQG